MDIITKVHLFIDPLTLSLRKLLTKRLHKQNFNIALRAPITFTSQSTSRYYIGLICQLSIVSDRLNVLHFYAIMLLFSSIFFKDIILHVTYYTVRSLYHYATIKGWHYMQLRKMTISLTNNMNISPGV